MYTSNKKKKLWLDYYHSSPASGMRQWKIPGVQRPTVMAENRGGGTITTHVMAEKLPTFKTDHSNGSSTSRTIIHFLRLAR